MQVPNVEQTACLFSTLVYTFLDATVFKAYNVAHLLYNELPLLCDYDRSKVLAVGSSKTNATGVLKAHSKIRSNGSPERSGRSSPMSISTTHRPRVP